MYAQSGGQSVLYKLSTESLENLIQSNTDDSTKVEVYNELAQRHIFKQELSQALEYAQKALSLSNQLAYEQGQAQAFKRIGTIFYIEGNYQKSLEYQTQSLKILRKTSTNRGLATTLNSIALAYWKQGDYAQAKQYYEEALKPFREEAQPSEIAAGIFNNLAVLHKDQKNYVDAQRCYQQALDIRTALNNRQAMAASHLQLGLLYTEMAKATETAFHLEESIRLYEALNDFRGIMNTYNAQAAFFLLDTRYPQALTSGRRALQVAQNLGDKEGQARSHELMAKAWEGQNSPANALFHYKAYLRFKELAFQEQKSRQIVEILTRYDTERKEKENALLRKEQRIKDTELAYRKRVIRNQGLAVVGVSLTLILVGILAVVLYRANQIIRKANKVLQEQKAQVELKTHQLEQQKEEIAIQRDHLEAQSQHLEEVLEEVGKSNRIIRDSIAYASHIQEAMLPQLRAIKETFPESFIFFRPRDVVSGDVYWFHERESMSIIAAIDCTGHGVPGAFLSMIGNELLNKIVLFQGIVSPEEVLRLLHLEIRRTLKQKELSIWDGMDMSICVVYKDKPIIELAAAKQSVLYVQQGELHHVKGDRLSIGGITNTDDEVLYTKHTISVDQPTTLYLFSDGYHDQFGTLDGRRTKYKLHRFKDLLLRIHTLPMPEQKQALEAAFETWMEGHEQVDDVLVIGLQYGVS